MKPKIKILLHSLMRDVSRGISTPEQAEAEFIKSTGQKLEDVVDLENPQVGEFLALLVGAYQIPTAQAPEVDLAALPEGFLETDPQTPVDLEKLAALVQPLNEAAPQDPEAGTVADTETETVPEPIKSDAPAVPVDHPKRTRKQTAPKDNQ